MKLVKLILFLVTAPHLFADLIPFLQIVGPSAVQVGSTFTEQVLVVNVFDLFAWQTDFSYLGSSKLSVLSISEGPFLSTAGNTYFVPGADDPTSGVITNTADVLLGPGPGAFGAGILFSVNLRAVSVGGAPLSLTNSQLYDSNGNAIPFIPMPLFLTVYPSFVGSEAPVPEPSTWLLGVAPFLILLLARRSWIECSLRIRAAPDASVSYSRES